MEIQLNGQPYRLDKPTTAAQLVDALGLGEKRYAVEINETIVPRSQLAEKNLTAGDKVEIIQAIGGG